MITSQKIGKTPLPNFYQKTPTEGDVDRFVGAASGSRELFFFTVADQDVTYIEEVTDEQYLVVLQIPYLVGVNQLMVFYSFGPDNWEMLMNKDEATATGLASTSIMHFEEVDSYTVRLYTTLTPSTANDGHKFLFVIPHTAAPISTREKIIVRDQGDNKAIEFEGEGDGLLMKSPNGAKWLVRIDDSGNIVSESR